MTNDELKTWLLRDQTDLVNSVAREIREHVTVRKSEGIDSDRTFEYRF
ncbi:MAG: hypothetical protein K2W95_14030 [Candidatus Obscuribacterales bacterium]|nr:hypothetical protein [Candidatus Obscuribacterales bacterium]